MKFSVLIISLALFNLGHVSCICSDQSEQLQKAQARSNDLRLGVYATSHQVEKLATDKDTRSKTWEILQQYGITKVYVEVYRSGHVLSPEQLTLVRDWLQERDIEVVGGIATVPGGNIGVRQQGPLGWFNWENEKTQQDLRKVIRSTAGVFDTFIIDDFLCTGDVSEESLTAKGDLSWGKYRRQLISDVARSVFIEPAKEVNPSITMIVKYPQWYDRFHLFGYDTKTLPQYFDKVWVGTETRGRTTRRYGYVQPYQGFNNYRWLADIASSKIGAAWFDHGDCAEYDFLDQAYMSILAGARELVFFNLGDLISGHPDHEKILNEFDQLADLATFIQRHPVNGIPAYKPPNSDPAGDMYLMDFLGMLGIPIIPVHNFPKDAPVIFLPAQSAADPDLLQKVRKASEDGVHVIVTTNLLNMLPHREQLRQTLGIDENLSSLPFKAKLLAPSSDKEKFETTNIVVDLESPWVTNAAASDVVCTDGKKTHALLISRKSTIGTHSILNTHTYSQADFDAVDEVLLCPRPLGLLEIEGQALQTFRSTFRSREDAILKSPSCVTLHPIGELRDRNYVLQNFLPDSVKATLTLPKMNKPPTAFIDSFTNQPIPSRIDAKAIVMEIAIPARGRVWIHPITE